MALAEQLKGVLVRLGLVLARKIQVDIRYLGAAVAQEGLEGDVEPVLVHRRAAMRADLVRQVRPAAVLFNVRVEVGIAAVGAAVVGRQAVDLSDAGQKGHDGGADTASGAH